MSRDNDFPEAVKSTLALRVGYRCSNPECRHATAGPHTDPSKSAKIGIAAHITAASPGGPRFDPKLTREERKSIENGIWLCQNCARLIDVDAPRYPVQSLEQWKEQAENAARLELNRQGVPQDEVAIFVRLMSKMPKLLEEMAADLHAHENELIREIVPLKKGMSFWHANPQFVYYEEDHSQLTNALRLLEEYGFIYDVTPKNWPIYRMTEKFVDLLLALHRE